MLKRGLTLGLVLCVASVANAGYTIDVILPAEPAGGYLGGETIVGAQIGLTGSAEPDIFARLINFDFAASNSALGLANWSWAPAYQNGQALCIAVPSLCGLSHAEFNIDDNGTPEDPSDDFMRSPVSTVFSDPSGNPQTQILIPGNGSIVLGQIDVTLPAAGATELTYTLDAVNNAAANANNGARLDHDFNNPTTIHGSFLGGTADITVNAIPEPATLALLGIGGLAALRRGKKAIKK